MTDTEAKKPAAKRVRRMARELEAGSSEVATPAPEPQRKPSKQDAVIALLRREEGATLAEMIEASGWLPHSTRAVLTGLRKKGHEIEKTKRDDVTCYRIVEDGQ